MISRVWQLTFTTVATCLFLTCPGFAQDNYSSRKPRVISYSTNESAKEIYVAIMGEVAKPGVYHLDSKSVDLHSIMERAGGFTSDASKIIRVIRQGRVSHKEVFSETLSSPLFPGDLLIVDARQQTGNTSRVSDFAQESTTIHASYEEQAARSFVQIGLLNILDYPIVLKLRPEDANASKIVDNLGQPIELLVSSSTQIISPDVYPRPSSEAAKRQIRLVDGSVIAFDRDRVNRNRVPASLPKPIESDIALGAQGELIGSPRGQSRELRNLGQNMISSSSYPNDLRTEIPSETTRETLRLPAAEVAQPGGGSDSDFAPKIPRARPRIATLPFSGSPNIANSSAFNSQSEQPDGELIPEPGDSMDSQNSTSTVNSSSLSADTPSTSKSANVSVMQLLIIIAIVGTLIGAALLVRQTLEAPQNRTLTPEMPVAKFIPKTEPEPVKQFDKKQLLERLIKNELPMTMEVVEFPAGLALQGRIVPKPILRVDGPQNPLKQNGPHFAPPDQTSSEYSLKDVIAQLDEPAESLIRRPHFMNPDVQKTVASNKPSKEPVEISTGTMPDRAKAPLAHALFELEQGKRT